MLLLGFVPVLSAVSPLRILLLAALALKLLLVLLSVLMPFAALFTPLVLVCWGRGKVGGAMMCTD